MTTMQRIGLLLFIAGVVAYWAVPQYMLLLLGIEILGGVLFIREGR